MKSIALILLLITTLRADISVFGAVYPSARNNLFLEQDKFMKDLSIFIQIVSSIDGLKVSGRELGRTVYQQKRYVLLGLSKTYNSKHLQFLAIDMEFLYHDKVITHTDSNIMRAIADIWESLDEANESGYFWKFKDSGHFQRNKYEGIF